MHTRIEFGFIESGHLVVESKNKKEWTNMRMTGEIFKSLFENVLPKLKPNIVIII